MKLKLKPLLSLSVSSLLLLLLFFRALWFVYLTFFHVLRRTQMISLRVQTSLKCSGVAFFLIRFACFECIRFAPLRTHFPATEQKKNFNFVWRESCTELAKIPKTIRFIESFFFPLFAFKVDNYAAMCNSIPFHCIQYCAFRCKHKSAE